MPHALGHERLDSSSEPDASELFESAPVAMHWVGPDGEILRANRADLELLGYARQDYVGRNIADFHADRSVIEAMLERLRAGEEMVQGQRAALRCRNGEIKHVVIDSAAVRRNGAFVQAQCFTRDITPQRQAEETLSRQHQQLRALYRLSDAVHRAADVDEVCDIAMTALLEAIGCDRASVLLFDAGGTMRFKAWRGLSDGYRRAVEGHSPWKPDERAAQPIVMEDVAARDDLGTLRAVVLGEGIGALGFIPLSGHGRLLGKFMLYFNRPHVFTPEVIRLTQTIAGHVGFALERRLAQDALRESETRYRRLMSLLPVAVYTCDAPAGAITFFNRRAAELWGREPRLGETDERFCRAFRLHLPDGAPLPHDRTPMAAAVLRGESCRNQDVIIERPDGSRVTVQVNIDPIRDERGRVIGAINVFNDITALREAQEAVRRSERLYRGIGESIDYGIWVCDAEGRNIYASQSFLDLVGITQEQCSEYGWTGLLHPAEAEATRLAWQKCARGGSFWEREHRFRGRDGRWYDLLARGVPIRDDQGRILWWAGINLDISALKRTQEELRTHKERLEELVAERTAQLEKSHAALRLSERMAAMGTLVAGLGHDMGNLLLPVRARLDSMQKTALNETAGEDVVAIRTCVEHLQQLASGLRLFALDPEADAGSHENTNLARWRCDVEPFMRNALPRSVRLEWAIQDDRLPEIAITRHRLTQAVYNLAKNAGDALHGRPQGLVRIWAALGENGQRVRLGVSDDGPGMSSEVKRRCLEPFFTTRQRGLSTGLGLSLVHGIVQRSGGSIEIETEPGAGTTIILTLPVARPADRAADGPRPLARVCVGNKRLASFIHTVLEGGGFDLAAPSSRPTDQQPWAVVVDDYSAAALQRALEFVAADDARHALLIGAAAGGIDELLGHAHPRLTILESDPKPSQLRQALQQITRRILQCRGSEAPPQRSGADQGEFAHAGS